MDVIEVYEQIKDRRGMVDYFDTIMNSTYSALRDRQEQEYSENLTKTFILELHNPEKSKQKITTFIDFLKKQEYKIKEIDGTLLSLHKDDALFFLDYYNPRFLIAHSPSKSQICGEAVDSIIKKFPLLDRAWLNTSLLESLSYVGDFESWKTVFSSKKVFTELQLRENRDLDWEELNMTVKTKNPRQKLTQIRETKIFENMLPITGIRIKKESDENNFAREDINFVGKFTARGNNFIDHLEVVTEFSKKYAFYIEGIEAKFSLNYSKENGFDGEPIVIEYPEIQPEYFKMIINNWFNGTHPFLLWGIIDYKTDDYAVVNAIDLHIGHQISVEINRDFMRVYLFKGTCGNTVARLLANLEQYFKSSVHVSNNIYGNLI